MGFSIVVVHKHSTIQISNSCQISGYLYRMSPHTIFLYFVLAYDVCKNYFIYHSEAESKHTHGGSRYTHTHTHIHRRVITLRTPPSYINVRTWQPNNGKGRLQFTDQCFIYHTRTSIQSVFGVKMGKNCRFI